MSFESTWWCNSSSFLGKKENRNLQKQIESWNIDLGTYPYEHLTIYVFIKKSQRIFQKQLIEL